MTDSERYEYLIKQLLEMKASESLKQFEVFGSRHYRGKSDHDHQIDVSIVFSIADVRILVLVECKHYSRKVRVDDVLELAARLEDIGAQKGIIVTTIGFQKGAEKVAKSKGIALVIACDLGWFPTIETPIAGTLRHREFLDTVRMYLLWLLPHKTVEPNLSSAVERIGAFDVISGRGLKTQPFCSLSEGGWGIRYGTDGVARHGFIVVGGPGENLVLDAAGLCELIGIELMHDRLKPIQSSDRAAEH